MTVRIHPSAFVGDGVEIGEGTVVGPFAVLLGPCRIGRDAWIAPHAVVGTPPEHKAHGRPVAWDGEIDGVGVVIGDRVLLREHSAVHQGTERATRIEDDCYLMSRSHVGHDAHLMRGVTLAPGASLAGHCTVGEGANIGMGALVHQRVVIAPGAMVGMGAAVRRDVTPFTTVVGNPARVAGVNRVALLRLGASEALLEAWPSVVSGAEDVPAGNAPELEGVLARWRAVTTVGGGTGER